MLDWTRTLLLHGVEGYTIELTRYVLAAGAVTAILWIGARWVESRRIQLRTPDFADLQHEVINSLVTILTFAASSMLTLALARAGIIHLSMALPPLWLAALEFTAMVIAHDAYFYWMHRGLHLKAMFRRAHLTHHMSRTPTPWAAYSFAPIEAAFEAAFVPLFLLLVPFHAIVVLAFLLHQIIRNVIGHMGHELAWSGFTRSRWTGWLTTTTHHDLHHSEGRYNFGLYFTWWDRMMGTEHPRYHEKFEAVVGRHRAMEPARGRRWFI
jgi:sterol desaturase/sphingolipid hydroxylase (fatty acid hydroxylase superfamily)